MKISTKKYLGLFFSSLFATYTLYEKFMLPELQIPMITSLIFASTYFIFYKANSILPKTEFCHKISYSLFAFFMVVGDSFKKYNSFIGVFGNPFKELDITQQLFDDLSSSFTFINGVVGNILMIFSSLCKAVGYYFIIKCAFELVKYYFKRGLCALESNKKYTNFLEHFFGINSFFNVFFTLILVWLPVLIIKYPVSVSKDAMTQINQVLENELTTHHPFFTALLYGGFSKLGILLGDMHIGLFIFILLQYLFIAASLTFCIISIDKMKSNHTFSLILTLLVVFSPSFSHSATTIVKDALYSTFFVLYIIQLVLIIHKLKSCYDIKKNIIYLTVTAIFVCATRNNGIYVIAPTMFLFSLYFLFKTTILLRHRSFIVFILMLPLIFHLGYNFLQYEILNIERGSIREALSIPFQQTARYVKEYPEDVSDKDAEIIDKVLDYQNIGKLYNPIVSDPVKSTYKENASALVDYFRVWFKHLKKHPLTYIEATINTNYFAFYPDEPNIRSYAAFIKGASPNFFFKAGKYLLGGVTISVFSVPILSCLVNPVFYIWIFIYFLLEFLFKKQYLNLLTVFPLFVQILTVIAGPAVFNHPRYINPVHWSILFLIAYYLKNSTVKEEAG